MTPKSSDRPRPRPLHKLLQVDRLSNLSASHRRITDQYFQVDRVRSFTQVQSTPHFISLTSSKNDRSRSTSLSREFES